MNNKILTQTEKHYVATYGGTYLNGQYMNMEQCIEYAFNLGKTAHSTGQPRTPRGDDGLDELILNMQTTESLRIINTWLDGFDTYIGLDD